MKRTKDIKEKKKINTKKILPIIIASVLIALILFGLVFGIIAIVREATAVVSYNGVTVSEGVASYLASTFKAGYGSDSEGLDEATERYIRAIVTAASLYDRHAALGDSDREWIETNVKEVLDYKASNSVAEFNKQCEDMHFTYDDFRAATELIYKAAHAKDVIYGAEGTKLAYPSNSSLCEDYLNTYAHAKIIFIRTKDKFYLDEEGNREKDENGNDRLVDLTDAEEAERAADIAEIRELSENANAGSGIQMSLETFNSYYEKYNDDPDFAENGYYFSERSAFTAEYAEEYPNLVNKILSMRVGEWGLSEDGDTVCAIYRYAPISYDYVSSSMAQFFVDFYADAAEYLFGESLLALSVEVNVKDSYRAIDKHALKKNTIFKTPLGTGLRID